MKDVVLTHMHWDHAGHWAEFPAGALPSPGRRDAPIAPAAACATSRSGEPTTSSRSLPPCATFSPSGVTFHDGTAEIAPGITLHLVGGHTGGMQMLRVPTARGWVVLASDAAHFWHNIRKRSPFVIVHSLEKMIEGWVLCEKLADGPDHIIPGHDPEVLQALSENTPATKRPCSCTCRRRIEDLQQPALRKIAHQRRCAECPRLGGVGMRHNVGEPAEARRLHADDVAELVGKPLPRRATILGRREHRTEIEDETVRILVVRCRSSGEPGPPGRG